MRRVVDVREVEHDEVRPSLRGQPELRDALVHPHGVGHRRAVVRHADGRTPCTARLGARPEVHRRAHALALRRHPDRLPPYQRPSRTAVLSFMRNHPPIAGIVERVRQDAVMPGVQPRRDRVVAREGLRREGRDQRRATMPRDASRASDAGRYRSRKSWRNASSETSTTYGRPFALAGVRVPRARYSASIAAER